MGPTVALAPKIAAANPLPYPLFIIVGIRAEPVAAASATPEPDTPDINTLETTET